MPFLFWNKDVHLFRHGMIAHACNPSSSEVDAEGSSVQSPPYYIVSLGHPELHESLSQAKKQSVIYT